MPGVQGDESYRLFHFFLLRHGARCNDKQGKEEDSFHDVGKIKLNKKLVLSYNFSFKRVVEFCGSWRTLGPSDVELLRLTIQGHKEHEAGTKGTKKHIYVKSLLNYE